MPGERLTMWRLPLPGGHAGTDWTVRVGSSVGVHRFIVGEGGSPGSGVTVPVLHCFAPPGGWRTYVPVQSLSLAVTSALAVRRSTWMFELEMILPCTMMLPALPLAKSSMPFSPAA